MWVKIYIKIEDFLWRKNNTQLQARKSKTPKEKESIFYWIK